MHFMQTMKTQIRLHVQGVWSVSSLVISRNFVALDKEFCCCCCFYLLRKYWYFSYIQDFSTKKYIMVPYRTSYNWGAYIDYP